METFYRIWLKNKGIYDVISDREKEFKKIAYDLKKLTAEQGYRISKKIEGNEVRLKILDKNGKGIVMPDIMQEYLSSKDVGISEFIEAGNLMVDEFREIERKLHKRGKRRGPVATVKKGLEIYVFENVEV